MRDRIVAGNWKMNLDLAQGIALVEELKSARLPENVTVVVAPSAPLLAGIEVGNGLMLSAQNVHEAASGAFTGEFSTSQLKSVGVSHAIVGHSERRAIFGEKDDTIAAKVRALLAADMSPIFCCGETLDERNSGTHFSVIEKQLTDGLFALPSDEFSRCIVAYEPVWAIGTGVTASSEQAQEMHAHIRSLISSKYGEPVGSGTTILYGGSCKPGNADELFACPDVDGGLIGGASLVAADFLSIIQSNSRA